MDQELARQHCCVPASFKTDGAHSLTHENNNFELSNGAYNCSLLIGLEARYFCDCELHHICRAGSVPRFIGYGRVTICPSERTQAHSLNGWPPCSRESQKPAGVLGRINHASVKHHDPDICLLKNDPAALAYLLMRPHHDPDICLFENDPAAITYFQIRPLVRDGTK
jgi:hypothetical protein